MKPLVAAAVILVALAVGGQASTPEIDPLRARAAQGDARAQLDRGLRYDADEGVPQDDAEAVRSYRLAAKRACFSLTWLPYRRFRHFDNLP